MKTGNLLRRGGTDNGNNSSHNLQNQLITEIQERMTERKLKQRDTARLLGIDEARMSEILRGKRSISMKLAKVIRKELNVSADTIIEYA
jgi:transcriptional regulator with XRE-family HTH domain